MVLFVGAVAFLSSNEQAVTYASDYKNATYEIFGEAIALRDGLSEITIDSDSAGMVTTRYFGNEARGDLDGDSREDVLFLLTQNAGGSGTFYMAVVALGKEQGYLGTNAVLLGDRIAPQASDIRDGQATVTFAIRNEGEPMTTPPSLGVSVQLRVVEGQLVSVE